MHQTTPYGKNKSIKRIFLILCLFAKKPNEKNRKENEILNLKLYLID